MKKVPEMTSKQPPAAKTILSKVEPMSNDEKKAMAEEWAVQTLAALLAYADADLSGSFAKKLCKQVACKFNADKTLSNVLLKNIKPEREGRPRGPNKKWTRARYYVLLVEHELLRLDKRREDVLELLAEREGYTGINKAKKIEDRITQARKEVDKNDLPEFLRPSE